MFMARTNGGLAEISYLLQVLTRKQFMGPDKVSSAPAPHHCSTRPAGSLLCALQAPLPLPSFSHF